MYNTNLLDCSPMEVAVDIAAQTTRFAVCGLSAIATTLLLSSAAGAATSAVMPCEQVGRELKSLQVPVSTLLLDSVDHVSINDDANDPNSISTEHFVSDFEAPSLYLTPRVTNILRDEMFC